MVSSIVATAVAFSVWAAVGVFVLNRRLQPVAARDRFLLAGVADVALVVSMAVIWL